MTILAYILSSLSFLMSILLLIRLKFPQGFYVMAPKMLAGALSPYWAIMGAAGAVLGWAYEAYGAIPIGIAGAGMMIWYVWGCTRDHKGFIHAFGAAWKDQISPQQAKNMVKRRWSFFLKMNASPEPLRERDIPYWTISESTPDTDRQLLCDIWRPGNGHVSGLAFVYFHGGAWYMGDKDILTRPFFSHLVAQGHTVMDVAYRMCPEVDIYGMIGDVKRAIAWMKANASGYGVDPEKIVLGGASAGGHLALLAGYAPQHPELTPADLESTDLSVCGVVSYYGPTDLLAEFRHTNQQRLADLDLPPIPIGPDSTMSMRPADWRMDILLGGWPQDALHAYQLASPITHVQPGCPPTLLMQGDKDLITPVDATCALHTKLVESGVPAINVVFPRTDHVFDLLFPHVSPPAQSALYDVDRFLALLLSKC